jgi:hypothetical protein
MIAAHCSLDIALAPLSVRRSMSTSSARTANRLKPAASRISSRSACVVRRIGSTDLIRKGSMIGRARSFIGRTLLRPTVTAAGSGAARA